ncbi:MAG: RusA family crossover junction endodeoxyribonuclease [Clostridiales bacterium]|nr:RusA family crossover junction endodeoxyribonuclease [Clostridiales bacterium]
MTKQFFLPGPPPTTTDQEKRIGVSKKTGKPYVYADDNLRRAKVYFRDSLAAHQLPAPLDGGVRLIVKWLFPLPADGSHHSGEYKLTKPDTDNLQKALKDTMTRLGFWKDDAQVCSEVSEKFWSDIPGIFIHLEDLS